MGEPNRVQLGWRVAESTKLRFERYAESLYGETPGRKGRAVEDAMEAFMREDRLARVEEQLDRMADALDVEKVTGKGADAPALADGLYEAPTGKNPGDVSKRQRAVITYFVDLANDERLPEGDYGPMCHRNVLKRKIEEIANVHSEKTVKRYVEAITSKGPFRPHPDRTGFWVVET